MCRWAQVVVAAILLIVVAAVLIAPNVDLEPSALRALTWVVALFASFAIVFLTLAGPRVQLLSRLRIRSLDLPPPQLPPVIDFDCARLC